MKNQKSFVIADSTKKLDKIIEDCKKRDSITNISNSVYSHVRSSSRTKNSPNL